LATLVQAAGPCLEATTNCQERLLLDPAGRYVNVYRNYPLTTGAANVERAVIMIHGSGRNGDGYYQTLLASAAVAARLFDSELVAIQIRGNDGKSCRDQLESGEIAFPCNGWKDGFEALNAPGVYSFTIADRIITLLNDRTAFPNLKRIVVAGHSAGGQYVHRYAAANRAHASSKIPISYVVANPSSYLYLDELRPDVHAQCTAQGRCAEKFAPYEDRDNCTTYNQFKYGLEQRVGYAASIDPTQLRRQLVARPMAYLLGDRDNIDAGGLDLSCPAVAQGANRLERGINYWNYIRAQYSAQHELKIVEGCGHSATCVYASRQGADLLFPRLDMKGQP
jgi:pimeloyl-ACP methyl ester carboxylesterase